MKESQGRTESIISRKVHNLKWCIACDRKWSILALLLERDNRIFTFSERAIIFCRTWNMNAQQPYNKTSQHFLTKETFFPLVNCSSHFSCRLSLFPAELFLQHFVKLWLTFLLFEPKEYWGYVYNFQQSYLLFGWGQGKKLQCFHTMSGWSVLWIRNGLGDGNQRVVVNGSMSQWRQVTSVCIGTSAIQYLY